jgi:hypothetical protein
MYVYSQVSTPSADSWVLLLFVIANTQDISLIYLKVPQRTKGDTNNSLKYYLWCSTFTYIDGLKVVPDVHKQQLHCTSCNIYVLVSPIKVLLRARSWWTGKVWMLLSNKNQDNGSGAAYRLIVSFMGLGGFGNQTSSPHGGVLVLQPMRQEITTQFEWMGIPTSSSRRSPSLLVNFSITADLVFCILKWISSKFVMLLNCRRSRCQLYHREQAKGASVGISNSPNLRTVVGNISNQSITMNSHDLRSSVCICDGRYSTSQ